MGATSPSPAPHRPLTDAERTAVVHKALRDGTVVRIRHLMGWSTADLADRLNVLPSLVDGWEKGEHMPSPYASSKLWTVLVCALRYEAATPPEWSTLAVP